MKHYVQKSTLGEHPKLEITATEYDELQQAQSTLLTAYTFEEQYTLVSGNYSEFEKTLLESVIDGIVYFRTEYFDYHEVRSLFHRRIINLLTAVKLYRDRAPSHVSGMCQSGEEGKKSANEFFSNLYDDNHEFRFMEAYRNHVQHYAVQIDNMTSGGKLLESESTMVQHTMYMGIKKSTPRENKKFKRAILDEIPEEIDLLLYLRKYISCISSFHQYGRDASKSNIKDARELIESKISQYGALEISSSLGVYIFSENDGEVQDKQALSLQWDDVRLKLERRNRHRPNLESNFASGQSKGAKIS